MEKRYLKNYGQKLILLFFVFWFAFGSLFFIKTNIVYAQGGDVSFTEYTIETQKAAVAESKDKDACSWPDFLSPDKFAVCFLLSILRFVGYILSASAALFENMVSVNNFNYVVRADQIYQIWQLVRDFFNIAFMLILLFSAFATIFQVEKYSYKKILLRLIIMALLVNFSFPIARFVVDIANSMMYTLIQLLFPLTSDGGGTAVLSGIAKEAGLARGLSPANATVSGVLATIIFTFILAISLLAVGVMFVIRIVALAILIIFSPVAFVGAILPGGGIAGKWWDYLFRYSFFGPIMIFMIYIAAHLMALENNYRAIWTKQALQQSNSPNIVGDIAFFAVPIVLLWIGMGIAQQFSIYGAGQVVNYAQKFGKVVVKAPIRAGGWGIKKTGVPGGAKKSWEDWKTRGPLGSAAVAQREARLAGKFGVKGAVEAEIKKRANSDDYKNLSVANLKDKAEKGDEAAALRLSIDGDIDVKSLGGAMRGVQKGSPTEKLILGEASKKNLDTVVKYKMSLATTIPEKEQIANEEYGKLDAEGWKKQKNLENVVDSTNTEEYNPIIADKAKDMFNSLAKQARIDVGKNSGGAKRGKLITAGFNIP